MVSNLTHISKYKLLFTLLLILIIHSKLFGQIRPWMPDTYPDDLIFTSISTGRTTGHIADLKIQNPGAKDVALEIPPLIIPSSGKYQPYIVPSPAVVSIPARSARTVNVDGYCVDIHTPPVPAGRNMPPVSTWIGKDPKLFNENGIISDLLTDYWGVTSNSRVSGNPTHPIITIFPVDSSVIHPVVTNHLPVVPVSGYLSEKEAVIQQCLWYYSASQPDESGIPVLPGAVSDDYDPLSDFVTMVKDSSGDTASDPVQLVQQTFWHYSVQMPKDSIMLSAPLLFDAIDKIIVTTDSLKAAGAISTPFSGNPPKERESIIQQTFWSYTAALHDEPYTKEDFHEKLVEQFEQSSGQSVSNAPLQVQEQFSKGSDDFWNTFNLVGAEAKVLIDGSMMAAKTRDRRGDVVFADNISAKNPENTDQLSNEREKMDDAFGGSNNSGVKIHEDPAGERAAEELGAEAGAVGEVIKGKSPPSGNELDANLAEELNHSAQNRKEQDDGSNRNASDSIIKKSGLEMQTAIPAEKQKEDEIKKINDQYPPKMVSDPTIRPTPNPGAEGDSPPPTEVPPPANTNCICDSLNFSFRLEKVYAPGGGGQDTSLVYDAVKSHNFPDPEGGSETEIPVVLANALRANEFFIITFSNVNVHCHCVNNTSGEAPCEVYNRISGSGQKSALGTKVKDETKGKVNVKEIKEEKNEGSQFVFKLVPAPDSRKARGYCEVIFEVYGACFSRECEIKNQKVTECIRRFKVKISNP